MKRNKNIFKLLSKRNLKNNHLRNVFAIIAIALTAILFTTSLTIVFSLKESAQEATIQMSGDKGHVQAKYLTELEYEKVASDPAIQKLGTSLYLGVDHTEAFRTENIEYRWGDANMIDMMYSTPTIGEIPQKANEILIDDLLLDQYDIPHRIGEKIELDYMINGNMHKTIFTISGIYKNNQTSGYHIIWISNEFAQNAVVPIDFYPPNEPRKSETAGFYYASILFENNSKLQQKVDQLILNNNIAPTADVSVNPAYDSPFQLSLPIIIGVLAAIVTFIGCGYLLIYNIFKISTIRDIRFYAQLKVVGADNYLLKRINRLQIRFLACIGMPIGLIVGYILGAWIIPKTSSLFANGGVAINAIPSLNPLIFFGAVVFVLITLKISARQPEKILLNCSPIEALRMEDYEQAQIQKKRKKSKKGGAIHSLALRNVLRSPRQFILIILSLSMGIVLLNVTFSLVTGFSMKKFLDEQLVMDFQVGNYQVIKKSFGITLDRSIAMPVEEVEKIKETPFVIQTGELYFTENIHQLSPKAQTLIDQVFSPQRIADQIKFGQTDFQNYVDHLKSNHKVNLKITGIDDSLIEFTDINNQSIDMSKYKTNEYVVLVANDNLYNAGDDIQITFLDGHSKTYKVLCLIPNMPQSFTTYGYGTAHDDSLAFSQEILMPKQELLRQEPSSPLISFFFNTTQENYIQADNFLTQKIVSENPDLAFISILGYQAEFTSLKTTYTLLGAIFSTIVLLIGLSNLVNCIATQMIMRKREFALLYCIGLTRSQHKRMLIYEGLNYMFCTALFSLTIGLFISRTIVMMLASSTAGFVYQSSLVSTLASILILTVFTLLLTLLSDSMRKKQSVMKMLRISS